MPSLLQLLLDPASLVLFGMLAGLSLWEALAPARSLPHVPGWRVRGLLSFAAYFLVSSYLPLLWGETLARWQLIDLSRLGTAAGTVAAVLAYEFAAYWWHRTMHRFTPLWRAFHQMHHSAERIDVTGAFWFSPLDMIGFTAVTSLSLTLVGFSPEATVMALYAINFLAIFQHANLRTPQWLGYLVQRPESHSRHHERGVHADNYADLPLFDLLFGTFRNPPDFAPLSGFYEGASRRVVDMLCFRDVATPPAGDVPSGRVARA